MKILLIVTMKIEALPIINKLKMHVSDTQLSPFLKTTVYEKKFDDNHLFLVHAGKDPQHNVDALGSGISLVAWESMNAISPELVINAGTAGGFSAKGANPGDIYISTGSFKFHDRLFGPNKFFTSYGIGSYACLEVPELIEQLQFKSGVISTGSSMLASNEEMMQMEANEAHLKEMEAAHIAYVAQTRKIPLFALKIVTDHVDTEVCVQKQLEANFNLLISKFVEAIEQTIMYVFEKGLSAILVSAKKS